MNRDDRWIHWPTASVRTLDNLDALRFLETTQCPGHSRLLVATQQFLIQVTFYVEIAFQLL